MSRRNKVFISHSTKTDENLVFLNEVCDALESDFDVLVDRRCLQPSDLWHARILEWMYECDAAIILLSQQALNDSKWVKAESVVTSVRRLNEKDFKLIVVPVDGVKTTQIKQDDFFGDIARLHDLQFEEADTTKICDALNNLKVLNTPFEEFVTLIRQTLEKINHGALQNATAHLSCQHHPSWEGRCKAEMLARTLFRSNKTPLSNLRILLEKLAHLIDRRQANVLLDMLKGMWVNAEAASRLVEAQQQKQTVSLNSVELEDFTGHCYARKAWPFPKKVVTVPAGNRRTLPELKQVLLETIGKSTSNQRRAERRLKQVKDPILLMFPAPNIDTATPSTEDYPDEGILALLKQEHPNITIMLASGSNTEYQQQIAQYAKPLTPSLGNDEEKEQYDHFDDVVDYIENMIR